LQHNRPKADTDEVPFLCLEENKLNSIGKARVTEGVF
jgi:hypothetical protein